MPQPSRGRTSACTGHASLSLRPRSRAGDAQSFILNPPTPEPLCDCSADFCSGFATEFEAQQCFDSCWVVTGDDVHGLDAGWDVLACGVLPQPLGRCRAGQARPVDPPRKPR
jgi:hypothetical protein